MTEWIEVLLGMRTLGPKEHCVRWGPDTPMARGWGFNAAFAYYFD